MQNVIDLARRLRAGVAQIEAKVTQFTDQADPKSVQDLLQKLRGLKFWIGEQESSLNHHNSDAMTPVIEANLRLYEERILAALAAEQIDFRAEDFDAPPRKIDVTQIDTSPFE